ncbi:MAG: hydrogenase maturation protease [Bacteroidota bacterium]
MNSSKNILVLGIGNILLGDEGIGIHAINKLLPKKFPSNVELLDGGTGGFHLLSLFQDYPTIILIDATMDGEPDGTVRLLQPKFSSDFPKTLSAHEIGLRDLIESSVLISALPKIYLITISISSIQPMMMELSPKVQESISEIERIVFEILNNEIKLT